MVLIPEIVDAVGVDIPVLGAGGIGRGRQVAAALALGASGVWTGSLWLTVEEASTPKPILDKLLAAGSRDTVRSRALTGKPARQLRTAWTEAWDDPEGPGALPMPFQFMLNAEALPRIIQGAETGAPGAVALMGSPVGQIVGTMNAIRPTAAVVEDLVSEFQEAVSRLATISGRR
jgi:NAD(P)H-dependent flavin oxidoreductase YrpB (nitropropane dioxygenase family)